MFSFLITVIFNVINFSIIAYGLYYGYVHYGKKFFTSQIREKKQADRDLKKGLESLKEQQAAVEVSIQEQEYNGQLLDDKVKLWHQKYNGYVEQQQRYNDQLQQDIAKKRLIQAYNLEQTVMLEKTMPKALHEATEELRQKFSSDKNGQKYLDVLINKVKKS